MFIAFSALDFLESIYHNALLLRLKKAGFKVESQKPIAGLF